MTDEELITYGQKYAEWAKAHTLDSPRWHDLYRLELATSEWRRRTE
jgi:hypothetical protein